MRILIATDTFYPHVNGASYFAQRIAQRLAEAGHTVGVVAPSLSMRNDTYHRGPVTVFGIRSFPIFFVPRFRFVIPWTFGRRVRGVLDAFRPDVVHIQMHFPVSRTVLHAARRVGIPVVATNHFMPENLTHYLHLPLSITNRIHSLAWRDAAHVLRKTRGVSAPTHTAAAMLQPHLPFTVSVISNGIDRTRFNPYTDPTPARERYGIPKLPTFLFVGRLEKEKRIDVFLRAAAAAKCSVALHVVIAGHGADERRLKRLATALGLGTDDVTFTGFVPDDVLPSLYTASDCFVNAGIAELQCIAAMEAMASGLPVLAARAVALPELVHEGENGHLFDAGDVEALSARLSELTRDASLRQRMGKRSQDIIAAHDVDMVLKSFEAFYQAAQA